MYTHTMGLAGINHIYSGILELETGDMPLYIDFNTTGPNDGNSGLYRSVNFAKFYQNEDKNIISANYAQIFTNGNPASRTNKFTGNGNSGNFYHGSLKITSEDFFTEDFTFLVSQEQTGISGNGSIFSCLNYGNTTSGYTFGINDANKMYFEYFNNDTNHFTVKTSPLNLSDKNIIGFRKSDNDLYFLLYDNGRKSFLSDYKTINSQNILPSNTFFVGSGENSKTYSGFMDELIYIKQPISNTDLSILGSGFWADNISGNFTLSQSGVTGGISGYDNFITGITGVISQENVLVGTGFETGALDVYEYEIQTGVLGSQETFLEFLGNLPKKIKEIDDIPVYRETTKTTEVTGVTGVVRKFSGIDITGLTSPSLIYETSGLTGFTSSGLVSVPVFNTGQLNISGFNNIMTGNRARLNEYGMGGIVYTDKINVVQLDPFGRPMPGAGLNFLESYGLTARSDDATNEFLDYNFIGVNSLASSDGIGFQIDQSFDLTGIDFYANGLLRFTSGLINAQANNFYLSGQGEPGKIILSGGIPAETNLFDAKAISSRTGFTGSNNNLSVHNHMFFRSGYKLVSGIDYSGNLNNNFTGASGYFIGHNIQPKDFILAVPFRINSGQLQTGFSGQLTAKFFRGTSQNYFSRLRLDKTKYIETSLRSDLLTERQGLVPNNLEPMFQTSTIDGINYYENLITGTEVEADYLTGAIQFGFRIQL